MPMRLKAFTVLELMVAMALTGAVLMVAWWVYFNTERMAADYAADGDETIELMRLHAALDRDAHMADTLITRPEGLVFAGADSVRWRFAEGYAIRGKDDTLHVQGIRMEVETHSRRLELRLALPREQENLVLHYEVELRGAGNTR